MKKGFTLIELLAVIAILAILVIIALPSVIEMYNKSLQGIFLNEAQEIVGDAQTSYVTDSMQSSNKITYDSDTNPLDLKGRKKKYRIVVDNGKITKVIIGDDTYSIDISGADIGKEDITLDDIKDEPLTELPKVVDTSKVYFYTDNGNFRYYSTYSEKKVLVLLKSDMDLKFKSGWTASSSLTSIFRLAGNEYGDYNHIALVDMTGKTPNDSTKEWILNNIEEVAVGTNTTMVYDYDTNGRSGAGVVDVQCAYDFTSMPKSDSGWHWSPTDVLILKADMCRCSTSIGKLETADVNVFLKIHAKFSGYDYIKASDINGTCCNLP